MPKDVGEGDPFAGLPVVPPHDLFLFSLMDAVARFVFARASAASRCWIIFRPLCGEVISPVSWWRREQTTAHRDAKSCDLMPENCGFLPGLFLVSLGQRRHIQIPRQHRRSQIVERPLVAQAKGRAEAVKWWRTG